MSGVSLAVSGPPAATVAEAAGHPDLAWYWFGKGLAVANLAYFSINLFGFLIPRFLPRAFERYFQEKGEIYTKSAEDKRSVVVNRTQLSEKKTD
ncbi:hypothetical protein JHK87_015324 [Glycine soja]|nr:hypothetical protein JHK87_015324 [Glycine soja]